MDRNFDELTNMDVHTLITLAKNTTIDPHIRLEAAKLILKHAYGEISDPD